MQFGAFVYAWNFVYAFVYAWNHLYMLQTLYMHLCMLGTICICLEPFGECQNLDFVYALVYASNFVYAFVYAWNHLYMLGTIWRMPEFGLCICICICLEPFHTINNVNVGQAIFMIYHICGSSHLFVNVDLYDI